jgi:fructose-1,6-bisphosphatase/inositol monophosphatase family enzyme
VAHKVAWATAKKQYEKLGKDWMRKCPLIPTLSHQGVFSDKLINMDIRNEIPARDIAQFHAKALEFTTQSRVLILSLVAAGFEVKRKPDRSFVTSVDLKVEERLRELIGKHFPDHGIIGEEYPATRPEAPFQWIMDPIDGTEDFVHRVPTFGTILALYYRGEPVIGVIDHPMLDTRVCAAFGVGTYHNNERIMLADLDIAAIDGTERLVLPARNNFLRYSDDGRYFDAVVQAHPNHRIYRSCFAHTCAAIGSADATIDYGNPIWDLAASRILIEEAGGRFLNVRTWDVPAVGRVYGSIMGKPALVDRLATYFNQ